ncbi:hypothetical protein PPYR_03370 [Photinus pyralis]|uniref:SGNH hydrolase-type esterase domain-containing protein n=1 Tax=Photinus pyralis TaxID=7054 RepID=A0A1Y1MK09_PHOPY|nr:platelet-activating factor acetylhydrolase IB subunit beta-like [Photinus pyralis]KAB0791570.1 hypothetical protein PPYR_03370 [Photinus pyralis]
MTGTQNGAQTMVSEFQGMSLKSANICTVPQRKHDIFGDNRWETMHERYVSEARNSEADVVFVGDSIVQQLQLTTLWNEKINPLHCLNFGIGGDRVENVLWRLLNGELEFACTPKVVVLFVGTNNTDCTAQQVYEGICHLIDVISTKLGDVKIVLPTLLPRGQHPSANRERNMLVNELCMNNFDSVSVNPNVHVVPIHEDIVQGDGTISHHLMHDYLHLTDEGYSKVFGPVYEKLAALMSNTI